MTFNVTCSLIDPSILVVQQSYKLVAASGEACWMKIAYIDAFSGVAGDMLLAALLDAGAPLEDLLSGLRTIAPIKDEWDVDLHRVTRGTGSISAAHITVTSKYHHHPAAPPSAVAHASATRNHDDSHSHGHSHSHSHGHQHDHKSTGSAGETADGEGDAESKSEAAVVTSLDTSDGSWTTHREDVVRNLSTISEMLTASGLPTLVKQRSIEVFTALGEAEAKTHGSTIDKVHFHEVGAIDSIIDTVGVVYALHLLAIERVFCSALPFSEGTVWTAHGILPVPAPATVRLMMGIPTCPGPKSATGELVTPTGAALVRVLSSNFGRPPPCTPEAVGIGAGTKEFGKHPNILRVIVGTLSEPSQATQPLPVDVSVSAREDGESWATQELCMLEANIDDMTGEVAGYLTEKLLAEGSLDAWVSPAFMKKSRPAYTVHVLCELEDQDRLMRLLFMESTTLGVAWLDGVPVNAKPEYEDCKVLAAASNTPIQVVMEAARAAINMATTATVEKQGSP